ncbi:alpha,alpha-phosphotrehalase [Vibrio sp. S4M6]|uniref:alpha,alpha-phosphotrehalase n=1 Tax=Vibrio sinus TaxID=2946865 RepID=UPI002029EF21|nr:alpha,alpha-phosphotrehalase [Vibrio sinus]MCL9782805.1 alpha,alpha-phosphotrehalase [Vibrio sinus]
MQQNKQIDWWKSATIYQIYPKSFCDSGAKGVGDIQGIISKLGYLNLLGVEAIWLTPIYPSPMVDNGYDISDYYAINPDFGTMADFDELLEKSHALGIKIIMDIVVNHTSTQHAWFQSAISDPDSVYRDYYIWKDLVNGQEPNNWQSKFGGSAWELEPNSGQYYLHLFAKQQADLNWENPQVRQEVKNVIRYWAKKGVDGFRLDVINLISKDQTFSDDEQGDGRRFYTDGPRVHEYLQDLSADVFQKYGCVTVGEMSSTTLEHCQRYSSLEGKELSMVFNFHHLKVDYPDGEKWALAPFDFIALKQIFDKWQKGLHQKGWGALFWCNHDQPRIVSRLGDDGQYRVKSAKMLAAALHMMQGTPYIYQGEEIGMTNPGYSRIGQYQDVESLTMYQLLVEQGVVSKKEMLAILAQKSRDNSRTPMQWSSEKNAGFTQGRPWLDVAENYTQINANLAVDDPDSVFYFYQTLIQLRKQFPVITDGDYTDLLPDDKAVFAYQRRLGDLRLICLNNFYQPETSVQLEVDCDLSQATYLLGNYADIGSKPLSHNIVLRAYESRVILIES